MPHFARKGDIQDLTTKDTTVHGHLVTKEDPSYATILKSASGGAKEKGTSIPNRTSRSLWTSKSSSSRHICQMHILQR